MYRLKPFGVLNGREVPVIELFSDKCAVELLPYGAAVRAIRVPDRTGKLTDICLGYDELESYRTLDACFGGTIGRCANQNLTKTVLIHGDCHQNSNIFVLSAPVAAVSFLVYSH